MRGVAEVRTSWLDLSVHKVILERGGVDVAEFVYTYDVGGRVEKIAYPDGIEVHFDDGGSPAQSGWNPNGQLTQIRYLKDDGLGGLELVRSYQYAYDDTGNRTHFDDYINNRTLWYTYKTVGSGSAIKYSDEIAEVLVASGTGKRAPADIADFTSLEKFVSDADGNIVQRTSSSGRINYDWDDSNNLLSVNFDNGNSTQNVYDPSSIREEALKNSGERVKSFYSGLPNISEESTTSANDISYFQGHHRFDVVLTIS